MLNFAHAPNSTPAVRGAREVSMPPPFSPKLPEWFGDVVGQSQVTPLPESPWRVDVAVAVDPSVTGTVTSLSVGERQALIHLVTNEGDITVPLYSDKRSDPPLTPREGMWRGGMLAVAQRAITHGHRMTVHFKKTAGLVEGEPDFPVAITLEAGRV